MNGEDESHKAVEAEIALIERMTLAQARAAWASRWGAPPQFRSVDLLRRLIAWRLQAGVFGDLDAETRIVLRQRSMPKPPLPPPGCRLTREYRGVLHHVDVEKEGYRYQGSRYDNLSEVARLITGTRWNGPRFFGLRRPLTDR